MWPKREGHWWSKKGGTPLFSRRFRALGRMWETAAGLGQGGGRGPCSADRVCVDVCEWPCALGR